MHALKAIKDEVWQTELNPLLNSLIARKLLLRKRIRRITGNHCNKREMISPQYRIFVGGLAKKEEPCLALNGADKKRCLFE